MGQTRLCRYVTLRALEADMRRKGATPKTVNLDGLQKYVAIREASSVGFETAYWRPLYRAMRFTAWTKRKSSAGRFIDRIREKYGNDGRTGNAQVVVL